MTFTHQQKYITSNTITKKLFHHRPPPLLPQPLINRDTTKANKQVKEIKEILSFWKRVRAEFF